MIPLGAAECEEKGRGLGKNVGGGGGGGYINRSLSAAPDWSMCFSSLQFLSYQPFCVVANVYQRTVIIREHDILFWRRVLDHAKPRENRSLL